MLLNPAASCMHCAAVGPLRGAAAANQGLHGARGGEGEP